MLETALQENTKAMLALTAALMANNIGKAAPQAAAAKPLAPPAAGAKPQLAPADTTVTYAQLTQPFLDLVKIAGRDPALAVIAPLKALNEIKEKEQTPGQYAALLPKINAALAEATKALAAPASLV